MATGDEIWALRLPKCRKVQVKITTLGQQRVSFPHFKCLKDLTLESEANPSLLLGLVDLGKTMKQLESFQLVSSFIGSDLRNSFSQDAQALVQIAEGMRAKFIRCETWMQIVHLSGRGETLAVHVSMERKQWAQNKVLQVVDKGYHCNVSPVDSGQLAMEIPAVESSVSSGEVSGFEPETDY